MDKEIVSAESLKNLDTSIKNLFDATSKILEEAGVPHTSSEPLRDAPALGVSVDAQSAFNPAPWVAISLFFFIGVALLVTAIVKNFRPQPTKAEQISAAVDDIISKHLG